MFFNDNQSSNCRQLLQYKGLAKHLRGVNSAFNSWLPDLMQSAIAELFIQVSKIILVFIDSLSNYFSVSENSGTIYSIKMYVFPEQLMQYLELKLKVFTPFTSLRTSLSTVVRDTVVTYCIAFRWKSTI